MSSKKNSSTRLVNFFFPSYFNFFLTIEMKDPLPVRSQSKKLLNLMSLSEIIKPSSLTKKKCLSTAPRNMVLAAMQSVTASSSLPIFGLQGPAHPGSAVTAIKDLTIDASGGKQPASHPECIKIKTEKAMYMESIKPNTAAQVSPLAKPKSELVKAVVLVPEPLSIHAVTL
ncbi:hypothetical protein L208DRAFT_1378695 [Tricholoma matsutake]|nr:hypothetical protein L208DRAFT_1378695 [Tricholoma matsutake 945]